jgi:hypothetical protein
MPMHRAIPLLTAQRQNTEALGRGHPAQRLDNVVHHPLERQILLQSTIACRLLTVIGSLVHMGVSICHCCSCGMAALYELLLSPVGIGLGMMPARACIMCSRDSGNRSRIGESIRWRTSIRKQDQERLVPNSVNQTTAN